jgi:hypothetical protein
MDCPLQSGKGTELIISYGAGTLEPETQAAFAAHRKTCAQCREVAAAQLEVWSALDEFHPLPISADFDEKLYRRIAEEEQYTWWQRLLRTNWTWRPAMPAVAACAVLIAAFVLKTPWSTTPPDVPSQPKLQIEQVERALDDLEMLKQVGMEAAPDKAPVSEEL